MVLHLAFEDTYYFAAVDNHLQVDSLDLIAAGNPAQIVEDNSAVDNQIEVDNPVVDSQVEADIQVVDSQIEEDNQVADSQVVDIHSLVADLWIKKEFVVGIENWVEETVRRTGWRYSWIRWWTIMHINFVWIWRIWEYRIRKPSIKAWRRCICWRWSLVPVTCEELTIVSIWFAKQIRCVTHLKVESRVVDLHHGHFVGPCGQLVASLARTQ